jgi:uncharacterized protein YndB with AHSA1/START domain
MLETRSNEVTLMLPSDREIVVTRTFERPRHLLFEAWTKPEHMRQWWGCDGSMLTLCEVDLRPAGAWRVVMRMADGSEHPFHGVYREVKPNERLVYTEQYDMPSVGSPEWVTTILFEEVEGGTKLTHSILHRSAEARNGHLQAGMEAGTVQILNRLDQHVAAMEEAGVSIG